MKRKLSICLIFISITFLFGCASSVPEEIEAEATFTGTIEEIHGEQALVAIETGEILRSGTEVMVDLSARKGERLQVGDRVQVRYSGGVEESLPLGINTTAIEKISD